MAEDLTQAEADALLAMEKHRVDEQHHPFPGYGVQLWVGLKSVDGRELFSLDITRGRVDLAKVTYQNRARVSLVIARLDIAGAPHRNPDGSEVLCPHLHVYREGYEDKWATPAPAELFTDVSDHWRTLDDFLAFCNVTLRPHIDQDRLS